MRLIRVFTAGPLAPGGRAALEGDAATHVTRVLRLGAGDGLVLFNGDGLDHDATITAVRSGRVEVAVGAARPAAAESPLAITLVQCVSRGERMDFVLQKATELGVARIVPALSERSVVRLDGDQAARRLEHWQGVVTAACEQSGRARIPTLDAPLRLADWLRQPPAAGCRVFLVPGAAHALPAVAAGSTAVELLIGPEGGLAPGEQSAALAAGFLPASLGPRILRTETAALAALAILQASAGDLR